MHDSTPWTKKYSPKTSKELYDLDKQFSDMKKFISTFKKGKGLLLYGQTGSGKTSSVYALAHEMNLELIEINASDTRNAEAINSIVGNASKQASLFSSGKIILVDEVEGISGQKDRGGVQALVKIIEDSKFPVIITCIDPYNDKIKPIAKVCSKIEFVIRDHKALLEFLKKTCDNEKIQYDEEAISMISRANPGDFRSAINDLQSVSNNKKITRKEVETIGDRERTGNIEDSLLKIFKTTDPNIALGSFDNLDEDLDKIFMWVDENMPKEYLKPADLARGFDALSTADVFKGRIIRWQHYRFYVYCFQLLSVGIAISKDEKYKTITEYKQSTRPLKIWMANMKNMKKKAIAEKIAAKTHTAKKHAFRDSLPYFKIIFKNDKKQAEKISEYLELDEEQKSYLMG